MKYTNNIPGITLETEVETCPGSIDKIQYKTKHIVEVR